MNPRPFELLLFSTDAGLIRSAVAGGADGIIVDWERRGKAVRQAGADTEINHDTYDDLRRVHSATSGPVICRLNSPAELDADEVQMAIEGGATEVLLPMVREPDDVRPVLELASRRVGVGILIETIAAVDRAADFARLPLSRVYVGLNDLAIERRSFTIFDAILDGTIDRLRRLFSMPFGFGGLTLPERGHPVPCRLLMGEMARLDCQFSFLRRSFHRDVRGGSVQAGLSDIRRGLAAAGHRPGDEVTRDREALHAAVMAAYV